MDSTSVAAALRKVAPQSELTALRWIAPELPEADESRFSQAVRRRLGYADVIVWADRHWPMKNGSGIRTLRGSPFLGFYTELWDASFQAAREHGVRYLFSGVSGDNLFGGSIGAYADLLLTGRWRSLAAGIRGHLERWETSAAQVVRSRVLAPVAKTYLPFLRRRAIPALPWIGERHREAYVGPLLEYPRGLLPGRQRRLQLLRERLLPQDNELFTREAGRCQ